MTYLELSSKKIMPGAHVATIQLKTHRQSHRIIVHLARSPPPPFQVPRVPYAWLAGGVLLEGAEVAFRVGAGARQITRTNMRMQWLAIFLKPPLFLSVCA